MAKAAAQTPKKTSKRNSLTDVEVAVIKALIAGGKHSNQVIAGLINRARGDAASDISSGRISNIKNGQIKKYAGILAASTRDVAKFMTKAAAPALADEGPVSLNHPGYAAGLNFQIGYGRFDQTRSLNLPRFRRRGNCSRRLPITSRLFSAIRPSDPEF